MMTEFEAEELNQSRIKTKVSNFYFMKKKKFQNLNDKWKITVKAMKDAKAEKQDDYIKQQIKTIQNKSSVMSKILKENEEKKRKTLEEIKDRQEQSEELMRINVLKRAEEIEKERLNYEKKIIDKLHRISDQRKKIMDGFKDSFSLQSSKSLNNFKHNYSKLEENFEKKHEDLKSKAFSKFASWVIIYIT